MNYRLIMNSTLALATFAVGIMAGFFYTYTFNVNLAMLQVDGATYATVQSLFNENVRHFMFFVFFFGSAGVLALALITNWPTWRTPAFWLLVAATLLYVLGIVIFTAQVNLPLNAYTESWDPAALPADWETTRTAWNEANAQRVAYSFLAFICNLAALTLRASQPNTRSPRAE